MKEDDMNIILMDTETAKWARACLYAFYLSTGKGMTQWEQEATMKAVDAINATLEIIGIAIDMKEQDEWRLPPQ